MSIPARIYLPTMSRGGVVSPEQIMDAELPAIPSVGNVFWVHREPIGRTCEHAVRRVLMVFDKDDPVCRVEVYLEDDG